MDTPKVKVLVRPRRLFAPRCVIDGDRHNEMCKRKLLTFDADAPEEEQQVTQEQGPKRAKMDIPWAASATVPYIIMPQYTPEVRPACNLDINSLLLLQAEEILHLFRYYDNYVPIPVVNFEF